MPSNDHEFLEQIIAHARAFFGLLQSLISEGQAAQALSENLSDLSKRLL